MLVFAFAFQFHVITIFLKVLEILLEYCTIYCTVLYVSKILTFSSSDGLITSLILIQVSCVVKLSEDYKAENPLATSI